MEDEEILKNLTIGMWSLHSDGIISRPIRMPGGHLGKDWIWTTKDIGNEPIWDLPFHFAFKTWITKKDMVNLIEAIAIHRKLFPLPNQIKDIKKIDERTTCIVFAIIEKREKNDRPV